MTQNILSKFGITSESLSKLDVYKPANSEGRMLLYDGDGGCYACTNGVAKIETALRRFEQDIYEKMYLARCSKARVHLTPRGCFKNGRHLLKGAKVYQANRAGVQKPPLLEVLRMRAEAHFSNHPDIEVIGNMDIEADDGLMIDSYFYKTAVLISPDKDLNINPFESYNVTEGVFERLIDGDRFGWIDRKEWLTPSLKRATKLTGKGTKFFWAQMLMGDTADNVQGILKLNGKLCGEAAAFNALKDIKDENEAANLVLDGYRKINQNVIAEAEALWLLRSKTDSSYDFILEHDLSPNNKQFLIDCYHADWRHTEEQPNEYI